MPQDRVDHYTELMQRESNRALNDIDKIRNPNPQRIRIPAMLLAAEHDRVPNKVYRKLADSFSAELYTLAVTHDVMLIPQWKMVADHIISWLTSKLADEHAAGE
jgi:hypothetical protein